MWDGTKSGSAMHFRVTTPGTNSNSAVLILSSDNTRSLQPIRAPDGSVALPAYTFNSDTDTGLYRIAANTLGVTLGDGLYANFSQGSLSLYRYGSIPTLAFRHSNGTAAVPTQTLSGNSIGQFAAQPYTGSAVVSTASMLWVAEEDITAAAAGTYMQLRPVAVGSVSPATVLEVRSDRVRSFQPNWAQDGTAALPAYTFTTDTDTGVYRVGANQLGLSTTGVLRLTVNAATSIDATLPFRQEDGTVALPAYTFTNDPDTGFYRIASNSVGWSAGGVLKLQVDGNGLTVGAGGNQFAQTFETHGSASVGVIAHRFSADTQAPAFALVKTRGTTAASRTIVANADQLGNIFFQGADGSTNIVGANIRAVVDAVPAAGDVPARLEFQTKPAGASVATRLAISSAGNTTINAPVAGTALQATAVAGALAANFPSGPTKLQVTTVGGLLAAATAGAGAKAFVTDALSPAFGAAVAAGGAVMVPVYSTGAVWNVG